MTNTINMKVGSRIAGKRENVVLISTVWTLFTYRTSRISEEAAALLAGAYIIFMLK